MEKIGSWKQSVSFRLFYRYPSRFILLGFIKFQVPHVFSSSTIPCIV